MVVYAVASDIRVPVRKIVFAVCWQCNPGEIINISLRPRIPIYKVVIITESCL